MVDHGTLPGYRLKNSMGVMVHCRVIGWRTCCVSWYTAGLQVEEVYGYHGGLWYTARVAGWRTLRVSWYTAGLQVKNFMDVMIHRRVTGWRTVWVSCTLWSYSRKEVSPFRSFLKWPATERAAPSVRYNALLCTRRHLCASVTCYMKDTIWYVTMTCYSKDAI